MSEEAEVDEAQVEALLERVKASTHPLIQQKLTKLRREDITNRLFRALLKEITGQLAYKAFEDLETVEEVVQTPVAEYKGVKLKTRVALIPILRAGLGMVEAVHELLPESPVHHIGMYRSKESLLPILYFNKVSDVNLWPVRAGWVGLTWDVWVVAGRAEVRCSGDLGAVDCDIRHDSRSCGYLEELGRS